MRNRQRSSTFLSLSFSLSLPVRGGKLTALSSALVAPPMHPVFSSRALQTGRSLSLTIITACPAGDREGRVRLSLQVRNATSLQWVKNGINLKEGADGGRIMGVDKP